MADRTKLSVVEEIKSSSNCLRGTIAQELANGKDSFEEKTVQLLKHHGMYQQDNRDARGGKGADGQHLAKVFSLMVRVKLPGGKLSAEQLLAQLDLCDELGTGTLRITVCCRQARKG